MSRTADSPASSAYAVTPSDTTVLSPLPRSLYIGAAGNVAVVPEDGATSVVFVAVSAGQILPIRAKKVMSAGTTATSIVAMY
ncbi:hypothetical protein NTD84_03145 [Pseudomonas sp. 14P_8.1_Bac3]|uniref:spike base protein, RCAP_Rcc01079 family n=1 Tax=Pseudomonas sp. 14P_8.1_Bac3 TaxID=2971621 RepID=UPI0021C79AD2|nr:hypothetical protein [Pseudomonas sp. 14P_8.1_Bac3]MCU1758716.1 hypothetical protein [Pseudomonas sp. 14P_8.1_Bac3]